MGCVSGVGSTREEIPQWRTVLRKFRLERLLGPFEHDNQMDPDKWINLNECYLERYGLNEGCLDRGKWEQLLATSSKEKFDPSITGPLHNNPVSLGNSQNIYIARAMDFFKSSQKKLREYIKKPPSILYDGFLSHVQSSSQELCQNLAAELENPRAHPDVPGPIPDPMNVWYDKNKTDWEGILTIIASSECFLIVATSVYFERPYCCFELMCALALGKPIVLIITQKDTEKHENLNDFRQQYSPDDFQTEMKDAAFVRLEASSAKQGSSWTISVRKLAKQLKEARARAQNRRSEFARLKVLAEEETTRLRALEQGTNRRGSLFRSSRRQPSQARRPISRAMLVGPGGSGKTAMFRNLLYQPGRNFYDAELRTFKETVRENILAGLTQLFELNEMLVERNREKFSRLEFDQSVLREVQECRQRLRDRLNYQDPYNPPDILTSQFAALVHTIWTKDPNGTLQKTLLDAQRHQATGNELLSDPLRYFLNDIERIGDRMYKPTLEDCLRCRIRTNGIVQQEVVVQSQSRPITLYDAGGQRHERPKWIHILNWVDLVFFCVSLSGWSERLFEDNSQSRLEEAVKLFQKLCQSHLLSHATVVLVFTKRDVLPDRLKRDDFTESYPAFKGDPTSPEQVTAFIKALFLDSTKRNVRSFVINSLDRGDVRKLLNDACRGEV